MKRYKEVTSQMMTAEYNKLSKDWICSIQDSIDNPYVFTNKKKAKDFCKNINNALKKGELKIVDGEIKKVKKESELINKKIDFLILSTKPLIIKRLNKDIKIKYITLYSEHVFEISKSELSKLKKNYSFKNDF